MKFYRVLCQALCVWLSLATGFGPAAFAHTNDTPYGRAQVIWPDLGHEGGTTLQTKITDGIKKISDNLTGRWTGDLTVANLGTASIIHDFGLAIAKLKILVFVSGSQLTAAQQAADFAFTETDLNTIQVQNISGSSQTFQVVILAYRGGIVSADLDPALNVDTSGTVRASELRTSSNGDVVINHNAAESGADWKAQIHRPTSGMSGNAVYTLPLASATFATTSLSESLTNKNLKSSTNLLTGAKADSFVTETGSNTVTLPSAGGTLSTLAGSESLTNKTISSSSFNGGTASSTQFITLPSATLATLQALSRTAGKLYYATDTSQVMYDNGSNLLAVGSGSGSGIKNYLSQDFETDTTGISGYADAAATTPVDGTGGTATTLTISRTTSAGEVLDGVGSLKVAKSAANGQGQGVSIDFVMDLAYRSKGQSVSLQYKTDHANYVAGDAVLCLYDKDLASLVVISGADVGVCRAIPKGVGTIKATWNGSTSDDYRFIIHVSSTNASAYDLFFDKPLVTPIILTDGVAQSDWTIYTGTSSSWANTNSNYNSRYQRSGGSGDFQHYITLTGAGSSTFTMSLAQFFGSSGLTLDTTRLSGAGAGDGTVVIGKWTGLDVGTQNYGGNVYWNPDDQLIRLVSSSGVVTATAPFTWGTGDIINIRVDDLPISQWSGSANVVNGPRIEYACNTNSASDANDTTSFSNDPDGCLIPQVAFTADRNRQIRFQTAKQPTDTYRIEYRASNGYWQPLTNDFQSGLTLLQLQAPTYYGFNIDRATTGLPATDLNMTFARYAYANNGTFGGAGASWAAGGLVGYRYRVLKLSGVGADAYAPATATSDGFVSPTMQTFGGAKTFNDVTTFKHSSGATTAGVYNTSSEWTFGTAGGAGGIRLPGPSGGTPALLNTYEEFSVSSGAFTEFSGTGTTGTASLRLVRVGKSVTGAIRFVVSGTAGSLTAFGLRDATGVWPSRFQPASLPDNFHIGYAAKGAPSGNKFYVGLTQSGGTNYLILNKDAAFGNSEDTGWISFSYQMN